MTRLPARALVLACSVLAAANAAAFMLFEGDGSNEEGFVPPKVGPPPPPPPAQVSSAETYIPYPGPPVVPQARSEKKKPPRPPTMFTKLTSPRGPMDWNTRPNDLNNLLKLMKKTIDVDFVSEVKAFEQVQVEPDKNPILYRSGHFNFEFTPAERQKLREFLLGGGTIVFNAGMGSKPFYNSAIKEMGLIFPEAPVQRLSADHPIFHSYYDVPTVRYGAAFRAAGFTGNEPWMEGVTLNCRTVAVISRWCMATGWDELKPPEDALAYDIETSLKLGVNIMSYATAQRAWSKNLARVMEFMDSQKPATGSLSLAQVKYGGEWKTRHAGISLLLHQFNQKTEIPVKFARRELALNDPAIFDCPMLYLTGHEDFTLSPGEREALKKYLQNGGLLYAEACCGRKSFDVAFRREMAAILPGKPLAQLPRGAPIFTSPNVIDTLEITPALSATRQNAPAIQPPVLAVELDGHLAVIYSPFGLAGGWEMSQSPYAHGYENAAAIRLGENILMHAISQ